MPAAVDTSPRQIDELAVRLAVRRLARLPEAPWLHLEVARRMAERLTLFRAAPKVIVDWGSFLGAGADLLREAYPNGAVWAIEETDVLVSRSIAALHSPWWTARHWTRPSAGVIRPEQIASSSADLLWSNMSLHAELNPPNVLAQWSRCLAPGGYAMFSCLGPDTVKELSGLYHRLGWPTPTIMFTDMHDLGDMLVAAGFEDPVMDQETLTIRWSSPQALCDDLRRIGANVEPRRFSGLRTPRWRVKLFDSLEQLRQRDGSLSLTFEIVYGHGFKRFAAPSSGELTAISLEDMRHMVRRSHRSQ
jgi:malonyl-CoA O-methyltransferase